MASFSRCCICPSEPVALLCRQLFLSDKRNREHSWVETIGLASKMVIVMVTTFMSSADYAWLALLILMMSAAGFSALGFYLRRNCVSVKCSL